jgi:hypothetical protein
MQSHIYRFSKFRLSKNKFIVLIIFVIILIFTISALSYNLSENKDIATWKSVEEVTPQSLLKKVLTQKANRYLDISTIKVMRIPSKGAGNLYIFDYGSPKLCGAAGCLYSVYNSEGKTLLEFIANRNLPVGENLVEVSKTVNQGFPCLTITQRTNTDKLLSQTEFCYQQGKYVALNKSFISKNKSE